MSYILDALRRAEAQRQQQNPAPPGIGTPVAPVVTAAPSATEAPTVRTGAAARGWPVGWLALLAVMVAAVLMTVLPRLRPDSEPATPAPPAPTTPQASAPAQPTQPALAAVAPSPPAPILQPAPAVPVAAVAALAKAPPTTPRPDAIPRYADLPESVRADLPAISVQGVTWSENAALRHLIVNGRVLQEGQSIGPGHVLEQIGRDGSVLSYRGQRYRIGH